jgi:hypothetical protein
MRERGALERWIRRGRGWGAGRGKRRRVGGVLSDEAWDLLRQLEHGLEFRDESAARRPAGSASSALDGVSPMAPLSSGLERMRRAWRRRRPDNDPV